jgi:hypothetical protein
VLAHRIGVWLTIVSLLGAACGGGTRSTNADLLALRQPTPDPTLDAVVRDLPRALAGIPATATPTPTPVPLRKVAPTPTPVPVRKLAPTPKPTATVVRPRR